MDLIKKYIDEVVIQKTGIPYYDVLVKKGYDTIYRYHVNKTNTSTGNERLYMYSCSKLVTVTLGFLLIEKGYIKLDDNLDKYFPAFKNTFVLKDGVKTPTQNKIKIHHLFTMTAGFNYYFYELKSIADAFLLNPKSTTLDIINVLATQPLDFEPGEKFNYSLCHDVLAGVYEVATNEKFSDLAEKYVFKPLKMERSTFKKVYFGLEPLYFSRKNGAIIPYEEKAVCSNHESYESGGGGLKSTVEDISKLLEVLANDGLTKDGAEFISKESIKMMTTPTSNISFVSDFTSIIGTDYDYGYGVRVRKTDTDFNLKKGEFGWDGAAGSYMMIDPTNNVSISVGMHVRNWPAVFEKGNLKLVEIIYNELFNK